MSVKDIIATIPKEAPQKEEESNLQKILQNVPEEGYDCKGRYYKKIPLGIAENLFSKQMNYLFPLFRVSVIDALNTTTRWLCLCKCGNLKIMSAPDLKGKNFHSCGCAKGINSWSAKDLTGQRFSRLLVIKRNKDYPKENNLNSKGYWDCLCDCGKIITVQTHNLTSGNTKSCGCYRAELIQKNKMIDLTNCRVGHLTIVGLDEEAMKERTNHTHAIWLCKCDCGNLISAKAPSLIEEKTISCGCVKNRSSGEDKIYQILEKNQIKFLFDSCYFKDLIVNEKTKSLGRYDFIILNEELKPIRLIEYDGETHYEDTNFFKRVIPLETRKKYDEIKNEYAKQHNIPLIRIPYWEKKNITLEMLMGDQYLVT